MNHGSKVCESCGILQGKTIKESIENQKEKKIKSKDIQNPSAKPETQDSGKHTLPQKPLAMRDLDWPTSSLTGGPNKGSTKKVKNKNNKAGWV